MAEWEERLEVKLGEMEGRVEVGSEREGGMRPVFV